MKRAYSVSRERDKMKHTKLDDVPPIYSYIRTKDERKKKKRVKRSQKKKRKSEKV